MAQLMLVNPRRRRRKTTAKRRRKTPVRHRRNPVAANPTRRRRRRSVARVTHHRRRRNPTRSKGMVEDLLMPSLIAGAGAIGVDLFAGFVPIPANFLAGPVSYVTKGAMAIGFGWLAGMAVKKSTAKQLTIGALTVTMHEAMRDVAARAMPQLNLGYYGPGTVVDGMGMYVAGPQTAPQITQSPVNAGNAENMGMYTSEQMYY